MTNKRKLSIGVLAFVAVLILSVGVASAAGLIWSADTPTEFEEQANDDETSNVTYDGVGAEVGTDGMYSTEDIDVGDADEITVEIDISHVADGDNFTARLQVQDSVDDEFYFDDPYQELHDEEGVITITHDTSEDIEEDGEWQDISSIYRVQVEDSTGDNAEAVEINSITVEGYEDPEITTETVTDAQEGEEYSQEFHGQGGEEPYEWFIAEGELPDGVSIDSDTADTDTLVIDGTPTESGEFNFTLELTDYNFNSDTQQYTLTVDEATPTGNIDVSVAESLHEDELEGATVTVEDDGTHIADAETDANGDVTFEDIETGTYTVTAEYDRYQSESTSVEVNEDLTSSVDLYLEQDEFWLDVAVIEDDEDDSASYIEGAEVTVEDVDETKTVEDGEVRFTLDSADTYTVSVDAIGYEAESMDVEINSDSNVTFELAADESTNFYDIDVVVEDEIGEAIEGAEIAFEQDDEVVRSITTNADGEAVAETLEGGEYDVTVSADGYLDASDSMTVDSDGLLTATLTAEEDAEEGEEHGDSDIEKQDEHEIDIYLPAGWSAVYYETDCEDCESDTIVNNTGEDTEMQWFVLYGNYDMEILDENDDVVASADDVYVDSDGEITYDEEEESLWFESYDDAGGIFGSSGIAIAGIGVLLLVLLLVGGSGGSGPSTRSGVNGRWE